MSEINSFSDYSSKYNTNQDYSFLFGAAQSASTSGTFSLSDYASIKNGSYGKLLKAYYAKQDADKMSSGKDSVQKSTLLKTGADALKKSAEALKKADIGTFKTLFNGYNSFASKVSMKTNSISNAAARASGTYKSNGTYNNALSELASSKVDKDGYASLYANNTMIYDELNVMKALEKIFYGAIYATKEVENEENI